MKEKGKKPSKYILGQGETQRPSKYIKSEFNETVSEEDDLIVEPDQELKSKIILTKKQIKERAESKSEGKIIQKKVHSNRVSSYLLNTFAESKAFLKENVKFTRIYFSIVSLFLAASIILLSVFFALAARQEKELRGRTQVLNELRNWLDEQNREYMAEVLLNPSIYHALDSRRQFEQYLFKYSVSISYGNTKEIFSNFSQPFQHFTVYGGQHVVLTFTESYTPIALKYLSEDTLKMFSLFVSPVKYGGEYKLRDYRTFLNVAEVFGYENTKGDGLEDSPYKNFDMRVETTMTGDGNTYQITLYNFIGNTAGVSYIDLGINSDQPERLRDFASAGFNLADYTPPSSRTLTTGLPITALSGFESPLAVGSADESSLLYSYLSSFSPTITREDYPSTLRGVKSLIQSVIGSGGLLSALSSENKFYLDSALNGNVLQSFGQSGKDAVRRALKDLTALKDLNDDYIVALAAKDKKTLFDDCYNIEVSSAKAQNKIGEIMEMLPKVSYAFNSNNYATINSLYQKLLNNEVLTPSEETRFDYYLAHILYYNYELEIASAQAVSLIKKMYGIDFGFGKDAVLTELAENYNGTLTQEQKQKISALLNVYGDNNVSEISLSFYMLNSLIKSYNLDGKLGLSSLTINKAETNS